MDNFQCLVPLLSSQRPQPIKQRFECETYASKSVSSFLGKGGLDLSVFIMFSFLFKYDVQTCKRHNPFALNVCTFVSYILSIFMTGSLTSPFIILGMVDKIRTITNCQVKSNALCLCDNLISSLFNEESSGVPQHSFFCCQKILVCKIFHQEVC